MTQSPFSDSATTMQGIRAGTSFPGSGRVESQEGSIAATFTCHYARAMVSVPVAQRAQLRQRIVTILRRARDADRCIDELLRVCASEGGPDGLDAAIDVLAKVGPLVFDYAWAYLKQDVRNWEPSSDRAYQPNDDYWYILLRAVGRANVPEKERYRFIASCANAASRGIREGVVEGLRDLGTNAAKERIRRFAREDEDAFIRKLANEALDDLES